MKPSGWGGGRTPMHWIAAPADSHGASSRVWRYEALLRLRWRPAREPLQLTAARSNSKSDTPPALHTTPSSMTTDLARSACIASAINGTRRSSRCPGVRTLAPRSPARQQMNLHPSCWIRRLMRAGRHGDFIGPLCRHEATGACQGVVENIGRLSVGNAGGGCDRAGAAMTLLPICFPERVFGSAGLDKLPFSLCFLR
jgi:hypothetical protein